MKVIVLTLKLFSNYVSDSIHFPCPDTRQKYVRLAFFFLSLVLLPSVSNATAPLFTSVERLSIAEGLPITSVYSLMYDKRGFLWFGTPSGLVRYDSARFHVFSAQSSSNFTIPTTDASNAFIDHKGRFWLGSWGKGISLYDEKMQLIKVFKNDANDPNSIGSNKIQVFFEDSKGRIWIGSNGGGLAVYNEQSMSFQNYLDNADQAESLSHNRVWTITEDNRGRIWAGTTNGLNVLENEERGIFTHFYHVPEVPGSLNNSLIRKLYVDGSNRLWVGTESGFGLFDKSKSEFVSLEPKNAPINAAITAIKSDQAGNIWIGTQKGLYVFDPTKMQFLPIGSANNFVLMPQDDIRDITFDQNDILWAATRYGGLAKIQFKPGVLTPINQYRSELQTNMPISQVLTFYEDSQKRIWIGTQAGLLYSDSIDSLPKPFELPGLPNNLGVRGIVEAPDGDLWLATEQGIFVISKGRDEVGSKADLLEGLNSPGANQIVFSSDGAIWIALKLEGVLRYKDGVKHHYQFDKDDDTSLSYDAITKIYEDRQKRIWITTNGGGLNQYIPLKDRFIRYQYDENDDESLSNNSVNDVYQDNENVIWVATIAGLNQFQELTSSFTRYNVADGMKNANVKAITEDHTGNIWFSSDFGLTELRLKKKYFVNYGSEDNVHGLEFSNTSKLKLKDSRFVFGGRDGYTLINLNHMNRQMRPPETRITQIWIDRQPIKTPYISEPTEALLLPPGTHDIRIDFSTLDFINPENNRFQYRLIGLSDEWSPTAFEPYARFTGLKHGDYVFEIRGANSAGVWSQSHARFAFNIIPPLWQKAWFQFTLLTLFLASAFFWYKHRTRMLKNQKYALEKEISLRTEELVNTQKQLIESEKHHALSGLVAGVAHEINTPVGISITATSTLGDVIASLSESIKEGRVRKKDLLQKIEQITVSTDIILRNLNRAGEVVRSFKEVAVDQVSDERREFDLYEYLREIIISVGQQLKERNIEVKLNCPKYLVLNSYPGAIAQIMTNLLLNALIHAFESRPEGKIDIEVRENCDKIEIKVRDNGKGIPEDQLRKIFDPFYTTNRSSGANGLGLHIIQNLISARLQGKIECESVLGEGTCFVMEFRTNPS